MVAEHEGITCDEFEAIVEVRGPWRRVVNVLPAVAMGLRRGGGHGGAQEESTGGWDGESVSVGIFVKGRGGIGEADSNLRKIARLLDVDFRDIFLKQIQPR